MGKSDENNNDNANNNKNNDEKRNDNPKTDSTTATKTEPDITNCTPVSNEDFDRACSDEASLNGKDSDEAVDMSLKDTKQKSIKSMDITIRNFSNMMTRLSSKKDFSNFIIIYYSIFLIAFSLTGKYFHSFNEDLSSYLNILLSVGVLAFSISNGHTHYGTRLGKIEIALNNVKNIRRKLKQDGVTEEIYKNLMSEYDKVMETAEYRSDVDFFNTVHQLCKEAGVFWGYYRRFGTNKRKALIYDTLVTSIYDKKALKAKKAEEEQLTKRVTKIQTKKDMVNPDSKEETADESNSSGDLLTKIEKEAMEAQKAKEALINEIEIEKLSNFKEEEKKQSKKQKEAYIAQMENEVKLKNYLCELNHTSWVVFKFYAIYLGRFLLLAGPILLFVLCFMIPTAL